MAWVYFARYERDGLIKIGKAVDLPRRFHEIREWARLARRSDMRLLGCMPGSFDVERATHARFAEHRAGGRCLGRDAFAPVPELLAFIASLSTDDLLEALAIDVPSLVSASSRAA